MRLAARARRRGYRGPVPRPQQSALRAAPGTIVSFVGVLLGLLTRPLRLIGLLVTVGLVAGGIWLWRSAHSSTPVPASDAVAAYREGAAGRTPASGLPRPGVYTYRVSGSERGGIGPLGIDRTLPGEARLIVTALSGGVYQTELDYSQEHIEAARYRRTPAGIRITWRRTDITFAGIGRDDRRAVTPPSLYLPAGLRVGRAWTERYRTGDLRVTATSRVVRAERVDVGGRSVPTLVVVTRSETSGPHPGTRTETIWWAPSLGLEVRRSDRLHVGGTFAFRESADLGLEAAEPAR